MKLYNLPSSHSIAIGSCFLVVSAPVGLSRSASVAFAESIFSSHDIGIFEVSGLLMEAVSDFTILLDLPEFF